MKRSNGKRSSGLVVFICVLCFLILRGVAPALEDENWQNILQHFQGLFRTAEEELHGFEAKLEKHSREFAAQLAKLEKNKGQMTLWFGGSFSPDNLRCLLEGLHGLRRQAESQFAWFATAERKITDYTNKVEELEAEVRSQSIGAPDNEVLNRNLAGVCVLKNHLERIKLAIQKSGEAYAIFLSHLDEAEKSANRKTTSYWTIFYLKQLPSLFSGDTWDELAKNINDAPGEYRLWWSALTGQEEAGRFRQLVLRILVLVLGMGIAGLMVVRKMESRFLPNAGLARFLPAWVLFWGWAAVAWYVRKLSFVYIPLLFCAGEMLLAASFVCFYRFFCRNAGNGGKGWLPAVYPLLFMLFVSLILRTLVGSYGLFLLVWLSALVVCSLHMFGKKIPDDEKSNRHGFTAVKYLMAVLVALTIFGFMPATHLIVSVVFYALVTAGIGLNLIRCLKAMEKEAKEKEAHALPVGVIFGLGAPAIILSLAYLNLWFLSLHVGGDRVLEYILSFELRWEDYHINVRKSALIIIGFYITKSMAFIGEFFIARCREGMDAAVLEALQTAAKYLLWGFFALGVLALLGFNLMSLTVVAGGLSVGIGFGLQHIVNNLLSGLILLFGRSLQSGDTIQIGETLGMVRKVTIRNTIVQTRDNATLFVPNSDLITNKLINWSHRDKRVRLKVNVGVAYGTDPEKVKRLLYKAAVSLPSVLSSPMPDVIFADFGASTLDFTLRFWIDDVDNDNRVLSDIRSAINHIFNENGIEIAFPQTTLHIQSAPGLEKFFERNRRVGPGGLPVPDAMLPITGTAK